MSPTIPGTEEAAAYLQTNQDLRRTLGIPADVPLAPHPLGQGEHNRNFQFEDPTTGRALVLRINVLPQPFHDNQVRYEFNALSALLPSGCTPAPLYMDDGPAAPGKGALVIGFCAGPELDFDRLRPGDMACCAQLLAAVHSVEPQKDCPLFRPTDPLRALFEECLERFEIYRTSSFEEPRLTRQIERLIAAAQSLMDAAGAPSPTARIINTEPLPSHFLIPDQAAQAAAGGSTTGSFGSFVDWERPILGEVAQDLAFFSCPAVTFWDSEFLFPTDQVGAFNESYWQAVDGRFPRDGFDRRFPAWRAMAALRSATWCCKALLRYGDAAKGAGVIHRTDKAQRKLPIYNSDAFLELLAKECFEA